MVAYIARDSLPLGSDARLLHLNDPSCGVNYLTKKSVMRVHNRGSQIPLSRLFFFSIPPSLPILRPNPDPVAFFYEIFCLIIEIDVILDLPSNNCQFCHNVNFLCQSLKTLKQLIKSQR